jgi:hypothetical protein
MSVFDGTWRPEAQRPGEDAPVEELLLIDGTYRCTTCQPPYDVPADGRLHRLPGASGSDEVSIRVVDARTVRRVLRRGGDVVVTATTVVSPFGQTKRETQRRLGVHAHGFDFAVTSRRVDPAPAGAHMVSGRWRPVEADLPNHEEDTMFRVVDDVLSMRDGFGRRYDAPLDGTPVPYLGDSRITSVSVQRIDAWTLEEVDRNGDEHVLTARWRADPDGHTMHVRFEHASGLVQEQDGQRID